MFPFVLLPTILNAQLASSPYPMIHHDEALTQVTSLTGPESNVTTKWEKNLGLCIGNASVGEDYALYIAIQKSGENNKLHKLRSSDGFPLLPAADLGVSEPIAASAPPTIVKTGNTEYLYTQQRGKIRKWTTDLVETTAGGWPGGGVVLRDSGSQEVTPVGINLSTDGDTLVTAGSNTTNTSALLFAIDKGNGTILDTFDLYAWIMANKCPDPTPPCSFPYESSTVTINNTVAIAADGGVLDDDLVYVVVAEEYLFAISFDRPTRSFTGVKWKFHYTPGQSGTSPTVVAGRVYIASGKDVGEDATLYALDAGDGTLMASSTFDIGKIKASPVVEHVNGKNRIYVHSTTAVLGFEDALSSQSGQSLSCKWRSSKKYNALSGNASKSINGLLYLPFTEVGDLQLRAYAGAFDPDNGWGGGSACLTGIADLPLNDPCDCAGRPVWKISMGSGLDDICTRSLGVDESTGKPQVYFGTNTTFHAFE